MIREDVEPSSSDKTEQSDVRRQLTRMEGSLYVVIRKGSYECNSIKVRAVYESLRLPSTGPRNAIRKRTCPNG